MFMDALAKLITRENFIIAFISFILSIVFTIFLYTFIGPMDNGIILSVTVLVTITVAIFLSGVKLLFSGSKNDTII